MNCFDLNRTIRGFWYWNV